MITRIFSLTVSPLDRDAPQSRTNEQTNGRLAKTPRRGNAQQALNVNFDVNPKCLSLYLGAE